MKEVKTKQELKQAIKSKEKDIIITDNSLAKNVYRFKKIKKIIKWSLGFILGGIGIFALFGSAILFTLWKDYDVSIETKKPAWKVRLKKK